MEDEQRYTDDEIRERLKRYGLKATEQRIRVYKAMCVLGHASADAVYRHLGDIRRMTLATVYNVLESLAEADLLVRRPSFANKMYFDVTTDPHCHLYRKDTGEICDFVDDALSRDVDSRIRERLPDGLALDRIEIQILCHAK